MTQRSGWDAAPFWIALMVSPDELDAMITSGGSSSSSCPYSFSLKSIRSGPFSWTRSAPASACAMLAVNVRFDCDAPGERPNRFSAGQAVSTNFLSAASAFGAMSVATTCSPLARNSELQLAPITPVPMIAMRRMGLVAVMSSSPMRLSDFGVGNAGEVALCVEEISFTGSIESGGVNRAGEIGHKHAVVWNVERDTDPLHEMGHDDLRLGRFVVDRGPVHCVAARRVAAVGPVENPVLVIELEINRLRHTVEEDLDVGPGRRGLAGGNFDTGTEDATEPGVVWAFLRPVDMSEFRVDRQPNAPSCLISAIGFAEPRLNERLQLRAVEIAAHDAHPLAVAPIELAAFLIEDDLLRSVGLSLCDDCLAVLAVDAGALDRPVIQVWDAHVGPVDMARLGIDDDAVGQMAIRHDGLAVGTVRIHGVNAAGVQLKNKETRDDGADASASIVLLDGFRHVAPVWRSDANLVSA